MTINTRFRLKVNPATGNFQLIKPVTATNGTQYDVNVDRLYQTAQIINIATGAIIAQILNGGGPVGMKQALKNYMQASLSVELPMETARFAGSTSINAVVQRTVTFSPLPNTGAFTLSYNSVVTSSLGFAATAAQVQTALRTNPQLTGVTVTGTIAAGFAIRFIGVAVPTALTAPAHILAQGVTPTIITIV